MSDQPPERASTLVSRAARGSAAADALAPPPLALCPTLTAAENVALRPARFPRRSDLRDVTGRVVELAASVGFAIDPHKLVSQATISERQRIEIVKLMYRGAEILIFDEPSAALTPDEWNDLGGLMRRLAGDGKAVVLISHKLDEVFEVADRYTVLRDGAITGHGAIGDVDRATLVREMVGREVKLRPDRVSVTAGDAVLSVRELSAPSTEEGADRPALDRVSLDVRAGEIVGLGQRLAQRGAVRRALALGLRRARRWADPGGPPSRRHRRRHADLGEPADALAQRGAAEPPRLHPPLRGTCARP